LVVKVNSLRIGSVFTAFVQLADSSSVPPPRLENSPPSVADLVLSFSSAVAHQDRAGAFQRGV
jgi:hypothetical protein